jgi:lactocepin
MSYETVASEASSAESKISNDIGDNVNADALREKMNDLEPDTGDGEGMVIAIVDSEFDINHEAFKLSDDSKIKLTKANLNSKISNLSISDLTVNKVYKNEKVPFAYDYENKNTDVYSEASVHGTHVSGIAAANCDNLRGMAPNAQLVLMKCTDDKGLISEVSMIAGINDAVKMGVDVINLSIGASYRNYTDDSPIVVAVKNVSASPTELFCSASNSGLGVGGRASASEVSYDTGGVPGGSKVVPVVGNAYSTNVYSSYEIMNLYDADGNDCGNLDYSNGAESDFTSAFKDKRYEIVDIGSGFDDLANDFDVKGKIVVTTGIGTMLLSEIRENGGIGIIVVGKIDSGDTLVYEDGFPLANVDHDTYEKIKNAKYIQTTDEKDVITYPQQMAETSSYAINEYLDGGVQLSARGTKVLSSVPNDKYAAYDGTSMSSPMAAGSYALVKSYLKNKYPDLDSDTADFTTLCVNMMQNTADIIYNPNQSESAPYSPRAQGAGYINLTNLSKSDVVVTDVKNGMGIAYCGATEGNEVSFTLSLKNLSDSDVTYNDISGIAIRDYVDDDGYINYASVKVNAGFDMYGSITVPANGEAEFPITVFLSNTTRNKLDAIFENGFFLDGFVILKAAMCKRFLFLLQAL